jgi:hypothetical protein
MGLLAALAFFSHKLSTAETRYSTFDRKLLAAYLAVCHFRFYLEGRPLTLFTDHKPLVTAISKSSTPSPLGSNVTCPSFLSSPHNLSTSQGPKTLLQALSHDPLLVLFP